MEFPVDPLADFANTSTKPGDGAGKAIDPTRPSLAGLTQPGPDATRIAELEREIAIIEREIDKNPSVDDLEIKHGRLRAELSRLRNEQERCSTCGETDRNAPSICSNGFHWPQYPAPSPPQDVRDGTDRLCQALYGRSAKPRDYLGGSNAKMLHDAADRLAALARSDAQPAPLTNVERTNISRDDPRMQTVVGQSDAQPVGWRYKKEAKWAAFGFTDNIEEHRQLIANGWIVEPLYTAPPDASGLNDREWFRAHAEGILNRIAANGADLLTQAGWLSEYLQSIFRRPAPLRSRAADRSAK